MSSIPDISKCFRLMEEYEMLPNIRRHSIIVARVAREIIEGFRNNDIPPLVIADHNLVVAGALLHDIAKTLCLHSGCDHAETGAEICHNLGYPEIAGIVEEHVLLGDYDLERRRQGDFSAREIIYYADKRVRHEEIVSLGERLEYIIEYYGLGDPELHVLIRENFARCVELEHFIFNFLPFAPEQMADRVLEYTDDASVDFLFVGKS